MDVIYKSVPILISKVKLINASFDSMLYGD